MYLRSQTSHEHPLGEFHVGANPSDLLSSLHDVYPLPAHYVLTLQDTSASDALPEPWNPGLALNAIPRASRRHALLNVTSIAGNVTGGGQQQYANPAPHAEFFPEAYDAHSSINGISQWPDLSVDRQPPEESTENTSLDLSSASATSPHVCSSCGKRFAKRSGVK